jgi:hypothetical protein
MGRQPTAMLRAALALSLLWTLFYFWRPATFILSNFGPWKPVPPIFAFLVPAATAWVLVASGVIAAGFWLTTNAERFSRPVFLALAFIFSASLALSVHAARTGTLPGAELMLFKGEEILEDARAAKSVSALVSTYTDRQSTLSLHGRTKPPGFAVMYRGMLAALPDRIALFGTLLTLLASLTVLPVYALALLLDGHERRARSAPSSRLRRPPP